MGGRVHIHIVVLYYLNNIHWVETTHSAITSSCSTRLLALDGYYVVLLLDDIPGVRMMGFSLPDINWQQKKQ
jgi:hypothetical protein